ncbi:hypothetical protein ACEZCY_34210 [Streptacidiphilus sp. N1-12]|uniref:PQQ-like domain-containing protein n=2 Tax=Streptacidiphilus alkalitolerans TaxID=3342712 RepID=A0ABV6VKT5_9ACTN
MRARRRGRTYAGAAGALAVLLLASGCGGGGSGHGGAGATPSSGFVAATPADPSVKSYDPPLRFGRVPVALPLPPASGAVALVGVDAYVADGDSLRVVDTRTGKVLATVDAKDPLPGAVSGAGSVRAPLVAAVGDSTLSLVLDAFLVTVPAKGSTPAGTGVELVAVDTSTRQAVWTAQVTDIPAWASGQDTDHDAAADGLAVGVVGFHGNTAVVSLTDRDHVGVGFGIDLMSHRTVWHKDGFAADAVTDDAVVGTAARNPSVDQAGAERSVLGLALSDGSQKWKELDTGPEVAIGAAGPGQVTVVGGSYNGATGFSYLVDADSGKQTALPNAGQNLAGCRYDGAAMLVCQGQDSSGNHLYGLDASTGKQHWQLPDPAAGGTGPVPALTALWHGAAYGTTSSGPVVLDTRTGADRGAAPGVAPVLLDGSVGLARPAGGSPLAAYPAVG